jgi:hypothetical protein
MGILGVLAAIAVLVGGVQTAVLTPSSDHQTSASARTPTDEVQTVRAETRQTLVQSNR